MLESKYQAKLIKKLEKMFPGCLVIKNDPSHRQGITDLLILFGRNWAALEVKAHANADQRPNQAYYVAKMNEHSYAAFIYPENENEVLHELQLAFGDCR